MRGNANVESCWAEASNASKVPYWGKRGFAVAVASTDYRCGWHARGAASADLDRRGLRGLAGSGMGRSIGKPSSITRLHDCEDHRRKSRRTSGQRSGVVVASSGPGRTVTLVLTQTHLLQENLMPWCTCDSPGLRRIG